MAYKSSYLNHSCAHFQSEPPAVWKSHGRVALLQSHSISSLVKDKELFCMSHFSLIVLQANPFYFSLAAFNVFKNLLLLLIAS